jgi:hypothetical protein
MSVRQTPRDELARVLRDKQIITPNDFDRIVTAGASDGVRQLSSILCDKRLITAAEATSLHVSSAPSTSLPRPAEPVVKTAPVLAAGQPEKPADPGSDLTRRFEFLRYAAFRRLLNVCKPKALQPGSRLRVLIEANL